VGRPHEIRISSSACFTRFLFYLTLDGDTKLSPGNPSILWAQSISGDILIMPMRIDDLENMDRVRQLLRAHVFNLSGLA
jgi:hypothetical protein